MLLNKVEKLKSDHRVSNFSCKHCINDLKAISALQEILICRKAETAEKQTQNLIP
jgi:hypothetical protein